MSTLLEQASLVMIPSGYKEDVVYSAVPTDGSGDLSFTRASNGTRINSAGLVEVVPWNLVQYSEQFDNGVWQVTSGGTGSNPGITANDATAPNGTTTADKIVFNTGAGTSGGDQSIIYQNSASQPEGVYTFSVYAKVASGTAKILARHAAGGTYTTLNLTTEWQRFEIVETNPITQVITMQLGLRRGLVNEPISSPVTCYLWGAQLNIGSTAKPYFPTTDRLNVPRLTYQNGGGGCPSLLLEKQSTNLVVQSQALTISTTNVGYTATDNNATSPDGTQNASRVLEDASTLHLIQKQYSVGSTTDYYTASFFVKSISRAKGSIIYGLDGAPYNSIGANFDLTAQTITSPTASGSGAVAGSSKIENFGNGWFRVSLSGIVGISGTHYTRLVGLNDSGSDTYTGDPSKGFYAWGFQGEAGSYPTSYIPTTSASATRVADACFKTGISSLIGQTEGSVFLDFVIQGGGITQEVFGLTLAGGGIEYIAMYAQTNGNLYFTTNIFSTTLINASAFGQRFKVAYSYKAGTHLLYVNGTQIATSSTSSVYSTLNSVYINQSATGAGVEKMQTNQMLLSQTAFTATELASLTTI
jgi:hypothetical protein